MSGLEDCRRAVADAVVAAMGRDGLQWAREWDERWAPMNAVSGRPYRGINRIALAAAGSILATPDGRWCTYSQAEKSGWHIRKGERASASVEFWSRWCRTHDGRVVDERRARELVRDGREDEAILRDARLAPRVTPVFHSGQISGIPAMAAHGHAGEPTEIVDALIASSRCPVREARSDEAYYSPSADEIVMPQRAQFKTLDGYARVLAHEMAHSTAREVGRDTSTYGTDLPARAHEELVAELGSVFVCSDLGLSGAAAAGDPGTQAVLERHAAYLRSWMSALKDDPDELARASSEAQRAADAIEARLPPGTCSSKTAEGESDMEDQRELGERSAEEDTLRREREERDRDRRRRQEERRQAAQRQAARRCQPQRQR